MVEERCQRGVARVTPARELLATSQSPDDINLHHGEEALTPPPLPERHSWPHSGSSES